MKTHAAETLMPDEWPSPDGKQGVKGVPLMLYIQLGDMGKWNEGDEPGTYGKEASNDGRLQTPGSISSSTAITQPLAPETRMFRLTGIFDAGNVSISH